MIDLNMSKVYRPKLITLPIPMLQQVSCPAIKLSLSDLTRKDRPHISMRSSWFGPCRFFHIEEHHHSFAMKAAFYRLIKFSFSFPI